jgi:predicted RNA-binding protein
MCQAEILIQRANGDELFMQDVIRMRVEGKTLWLSRFFEEPVAIRATFVEADFLKHTVTLIPTNEQKGPEK